MPVFRVVIEVDEPTLEDAEEHIQSLSGSDLVDEIVQLDDEEEVFKQAWCTTCIAIKMSSKAEYQSEFTCNTCGSEVYTKQLKAKEEEE
tara:strand:- start:1016 stop:1282 length:267 start_codon:yes stop_codon:yes gene_type:complete